MDIENKKELLLMGLDMGVALEYQKYRRNPHRIISIEDLNLHLKWNDILGPLGDGVLYRIEKTPLAYSALVQAITYLAIVSDDGVTIFGKNYNLVNPLTDYIPQTI